MAKAKLKTAPEKIARDAAIDKEHAANKRRKVATTNLVNPVDPNLNGANGEPAKVMVDDNPMPAFLKAKGPRKTDAELKLIIGGRARDWVMADKDRIKHVPIVPIFVDNRAAPVEVVYNAPKGKAGTILLRRFADMAEFEKDHDFKTYPVRQTVCNQNLTVIQVNPKPWAARVESTHNDGSPPTAAQERKARDFSQPDSAGKPVTAGSSLGIILEFMLAGDKTMEQIVKDSGVEGGVVSAEDKVFHRIRFVLFRQHGVGHKVGADGKVSAMLPSGFDKKSIFKVGKR